MFYVILAKSVVGKFKSEAAAKDFCGWHRREIGGGQVVTGAGWWTRNLSGYEFTATSPEGEIAEFSWYWGSSRWARERRWAYTAA